MNPYLSDSDFTLYNGDAREVLRELPAESVHMAVTSPPFYGLRNYGCDGQIGLEQTPEQWVEALVAVFEEVKRVLRRDGTLWVECGDSYWSNPSKGGSGPNGKNEERWGYDRASRREPSVTGCALHDPTYFHGDISRHEGVEYPPCDICEGGWSRKPKDLIGQPFLLAFALREAGWYWRNVCIWHKPNPMPESVRDRFTVSHSYVLLFSKSPRYFFDAEAVRETYSENTHSRGNGVGVKQALEEKGGTKHAGRNNADFGRAILASPADFKPPPQAETLDGSEGEAPRGPDGRRHTAVKQGDNSIQHRDGERWPNSGRNARSVWTIATEPLPFEHYAAFPQALAERCIKAGTSERGCCPECGAPWVREVERPTMPNIGQTDGGHPNQLSRNVRGGGNGAWKKWRDANPDKTLGWNPSCACADVPEGEERPTYCDFAAIPCTVLDPFMGSGTTALVARRLGRKAIGCELNVKYCELSAVRTQQLSLEAEAASG